MRNLTLRQANSADAKRLFELRNHPQIREQSHNSNIIDFDEHQAWIDKVVLDESKAICIVEDDNDNFIGMVRFELIDHMYLMSWVVSPKFQGHGFGKKMVKMASQEMNHGPLRAEIKKNNAASVKIAEYIGMRLIKEIEGTLFYQK
ncbi:GNAT family N-acetyltransferase [Candidatus Thioglobus sp.]|nr:GNAT family N-acetyltransferase [Candidatus Thioglobus sp.]